MGFILTHWNEKLSIITEDIDPPCAGFSFLDKIKCHCISNALSDLLGTASVGIYFAGYDV